MLGEPDDDKRLTGYLLGQLSEEEQLQVEAEFFADDTAHQQLLALEDELLYEFLQGRLTPEQGALFQAKFLVGEDSPARVALARAILEKAAQDSRQASPSSNGTGRLAAGLLPFLAAVPRRPAFSYAAAVAAVVTVGVLGWMIVETVRLRSEVGQLASEQNRRQRQLEQLINRQVDPVRQLEEERSRRRDRELQVAQKNLPAASVALLLSPGLVRGSAAPARITLAPDAAQLNVNLQLEAAELAQRYRAILRSATGAELWNQRGLRPQQGRPGPFVRVTLPARQLTAGDYELALGTTGASGRFEEVADYYFTVVRK